MPIGNHPFTRDMRLRCAAEFHAVQRARAVKHAGPLRVSAVPNGGRPTRLGLAIGRRAGNAPTRNAIKRRVREAFRLLHRDLPAGYDVVVSARPHDPGKMQQYQSWLNEAIQQLHRHWLRRR